MLVVHRSENHCTETLYNKPCVHLKFYMAGSFEVLIEIHMGKRPRLPFNWREKLCYVMLIEIWLYTSHSRSWRSVKIRRKPKYCLFKFSWRRCHKPSMAHFRWSPWSPLLSAWSPLRPDSRAAFEGYPSLRSHKPHIELTISVTPVAQISRVLYFPNPSDNRMMEEMRGPNSMTEVHFNVSR